MKNIFLVLLVSLAFLSFKKSELSSCDKKTASVQTNLTGGKVKYWLMFYYDLNGKLIEHPLINNESGTAFEYTKLTDSTGTVREFWNI
jgi:signal transduction histidine kinase